MGISPLDKTRNAPIIGVAAWRRGGVAAWRRGGVAAWRRGGVAAWRRGGVDGGEVCPDG
ncbi:MAG: hypothetical protein LBD55_11400 [Treponema sp.]|nr:hypothetical protein [Treponema sp.]